MAAKLVSVVPHPSKAHLHGGRFGPEQSPLAPVAYLLSAFAAVVYIVATIALARGNRTSRKVAYVAIGIEMAGVIVIGALSLLVPDAFPRATVWSTFGSGYLFIPLILPPLALWWLRRTE